METQIRGKWGPKNLLVQHMGMDFVTYTWRHRFGENGVQKICWFSIWVWTLLLTHGDTDSGKMGSKKFAGSAYGYGFCYLHMETQIRGKWGPKNLLVQHMGMDFVTYTW